ncbi:MAG TPA: helix-turn-helix transcriptional regulator [Magnetospirillum sp.]|nr:helix-turn-helix transcriptional regulator [Magnetospirillum sp.]
MDTKIHIGVRVKAARQARGLTQEQLADMVGKSVETVSNIERGAMLTGIDTLQRIARSLDVSISYFFEGADDARQVGRGRLEDEQRLMTLGQQLAPDDLRLALSLLETLLRHRGT